jgi:putative ABC transport system substrate-binding protein
VVQFKALQSYKKFKRIGLIYNTNELNARLNAAQVRKTAKNMGLDLIEVKLPLGADGKPSPDSIEAAIKKVVDKTAEFLYMGSSSFLTKFRKPFTEAAIKYKLPVAAGTEVPVTKAVGLMAIASRYYNVGHLAADQARRVLVNKEPPEKIRIRRLRRFSFIINMETAHKLKLYPPMKILRYAKVIKAGATL